MDNLVFNKKMKRFVAYMLDMIIVTILIVGVGQIDALHPKHKEYTKVVEQIEEYMESVSNGTKLTDKQNEEYRDLVFKGSKYQASYLISEIVIVLLYFTLFPTFNNGMTVGKRMMKLKVVKDDEKESKARVWQHFVKAFLCPIALSSLLRNGISYVFLLGGLLIFKADTYLVVVNYASIAVTVLCYLDVFKMILREDGKGLSDTIARVKVIDYVRN